MHISSGFVLLKALHQTLVRVQEWDYIQTMAKYYVFRLLVCDVCVLVQ